MNGTLQVTFCVELAHREELKKERGKNYVTGELQVETLLIPDGSELESKSEQKKYLKTAFKMHSEILSEEKG